MNDAFCVCTTPYTYESYIRAWENFKETNLDLQFVSDVTTDQIFDVGFTYTEKDIRKNLNFWKQPSSQHWWNVGGNKTMVWFYAHLRMLNFYLSYPHYENYWFFDDDLQVDDWSAFFTEMEDEPNDFLAYFIFKSEDVESQPQVPKIDDSTFSKSHWFQRFPGDGDELPPDTTELFGSFFPIVKYSNRAMRCLLDLNARGFSGYSEGFVPTTLNKEGMSLCTLIKPDYTSDYFDPKKVNIKHKHVTVDWSWI